MIDTLQQVIITVVIRVNYPVGIIDMPRTKRLNRRYFSIDPKLRNKGKNLVIS